MLAISGVILTPSLSEFDLVESGHAHMCLAISSTTDAVPLLGENTVRFTRTVFGGHPSTWAATVATWIDRLLNTVHNSHRRRIHSLKAKMKKTGAGGYDLPRFRALSTQRKLSVVLRAAGFDDVYVDRGLSFLSWGLPTFFGDKSTQLGDRYWPGKEHPLLVLPPGGSADLPGICVQRRWLTRDPLQS